MSQNMSNWYVAPVNALTLFILQLKYSSFFQMGDEQREEERKAQEVELNNIESLIYKYRRDDAVKQNEQLLARLSSLLEWIEGDGQFATLEETKSKREAIQNVVSFYKIPLLRSLDIHS